MLHIPLFLLGKEKHNSFQMPGPQLFYSLCSVSVVVPVGKIANEQNLPGRFFLIVGTSSFYICEWFSHSLHTTARLILQPPKKANKKQISSSLIGIQRTPNPSSALHRQHYLTSCHNYLDGQSSLVIAETFFSSVVPMHIKYVFATSPHKQTWHTVNFSVEFNRFKFRVFLLLDLLPYQG